jgi:hypothetical protein
VAIICSPHVLTAQSFTSYRQFELGSGVAAISTETKTAPSDTKTIHQRPAPLQQRDWRPSRWSTGTSGPSSDPVAQIAFSFCDDDLFRMVIGYGAEWTEGMTTPNLVEAITAVYRPPLTGTARSLNQPAARPEGDFGSLLARWGDAGHAVALYKTLSYRGTFRLVVTDLALAKLASTAESEARRMTIRPDRWPDVERVGACEIVEIEESPQR